MNWEHLIEAARILAGVTGGAPPVRPRQVMLKRAFSAAYYAMFHSRTAYVRSDVSALIQRAETAIGAFCNTTTAQRRRLAVYLLLQRTRS